MRTKFLKTVISALLPACILLPLSAQDSVNDDVTRLNLRMLEAENVTFTVEYRLFLDGAPVQTMPGKIVKSGALLHQRIGDTEMIRDGRLQVTALHDKQMVFVHPYDAALHPALTRKDILGIDLDSMKQYISDVRMEEHGDLRSYEFAFRTGKMAAMKIEFSTVTWLTKKLTFTYREKSEAEGRGMVTPGMEIEFLDIQESAEISSSEFLTGAVIRTDATGHISLAPGLESYRLVNTIPQTK
jgi:hypothetical protein